ncbi:hypothetical protein BH09MYX1_BH09MYX1_63910 [soil metagenome]
MPGIATPLFDKLALLCHAGSVSVFGPQVIGRSSFFVVKRKSSNCESLPISMAVAVPVSRPSSETPGAELTSGTVRTDSAMAGVRGSF